MTALFQTVAAVVWLHCLRFLGYVSQKLAQQLLNTAGIQLITFPQTQHETAIDVARISSPAMLALDYLCQ